MTDIERFWKFVIKTDSCWLWTGSKTQGYGQFYVSAKKKSVSAQRFVYEHFVGPIPEGLVTDHLCRNRGCVNPEHLRAVTNAVNTLCGESFSAKNKRKTHCIRGHEFTDKDLRADKRGGRQCRECVKLYPRNQLESQRQYNKTRPPRIRRKP